MGIYTIMNQLGLFDNFSEKFVGSGSIPKGSLLDNIQAINKMCKISKMTLKIN